MARIARKTSATGLYHIVARGNNKEHIFAHTNEKKHFLKLMTDGLEENEIQLYAYCLMKNHFHIMLKAKDLYKLSTYMHWLTMSYARYYNLKHNQTGHVFQGRYHSECVETESYYWTCIRYIHNNPVKIYQVSQPEDYAFSSAKDYLRCKSHIICPDAMTMLHKKFDCVESFMQFHMIFDSRPVLDIKEDSEKYEMERMQKMLELYCAKNEIQDKTQLYSMTDKRQEFLSWCNQETQIPQSKIKEFLMC